MRFNKWQIRVIAIIICYVLPIAILLGEWSLKCNGYLRLIMDIDIGILIYLFYRCNTWELSCVFYRDIYVLIYVIITIFQVVTGNYDTKFSESDKWIGIFAIVESVLLLYVFYTVRKAMKKPKQCMQLDFPYQNGKFLITDAGDGAHSAFVNYHYKSVVHGAHNIQNSMRYAVDIVKINRLGRSAKTILRKNKEDYASFGETIYCPLDGEVVNVVDGIQDNEPFPGMKNLKYNIGNRVVVKNKEYYLILGHFKNGSVRVKKGDAIKRGDVLGCSGCSGLSPRPEIHMQLVKSDTGEYWMGEGVPFVFEDDRYPVKNMVFKR